MIFAHQQNASNPARCIAGQQCKVAAAAAAAAAADKPMYVSLLTCIGVRLLYRY
jgi:hypothetical protein